VLDTVPDPEIPVISVVELGIVRDVVVEGARVTVVITPTYSGCPAMQAIEHDVLAALAERGWNDGHVRTVFTPAWTTDWMSEATRAKLRAYGIAPPGSRGVDDDDGPLVFLRRAGAADAVEPPVTCPSVARRTPRCRAASAPPLQGAARVPQLSAAVRGVQADLTYGASASGSPRPAGGTMPTEPPFQSPSAPRSSAPSSAIVRPSRPASRPATA
jgi:ring-1,2-phenylacetyl-CoA epoxidase subunit PaaD